MLESLNVHQRSHHVHGGTTFVTFLRSPEGPFFDDGYVVGGKVQDRDCVGHDVHQGLRGYGVWLLPWSKGNLIESIRVYPLFNVMKSSDLSYLTYQTYLKTCDLT